MIIQDLANGIAEAKKKNPCGLRLWRLYPATPGYTQHELESKLLNGGYIGDNIGDSHTGYQGGY